MCSHSCSGVLGEKWKPEVVPSPIPITGSQIILYSAVKSFFSELCRDQKSFKACVEDDLWNISMA